MGTLLTINECCEEIRRLVQEGCGINEAIDKIKKVIAQTKVAITTKNQSQPL